MNAFEAFGIVQAVAMLAGVPVLSSDIPGVRQPVVQTGFGTLGAAGRTSRPSPGRLQDLYTNPPDRDARHRQGAARLLGGQRARRVRGAARQGGVWQPRERVSTDHYGADYYRGNGQAGDRPALGWYIRIVARYIGAGPYLDFGCGTGHLLRGCPRSARPAGSRSRTRRGGTARQERARGDRAPPASTRCPSGGSAG